MNNQKITFSDQRCQNITSDNKKYWEGAPEANCDDREYCHSEAKEFVEITNIPRAEYLRHSDKTICYAETYARYLLKGIEFLDQQ